MLFKIPVLPGFNHPLSTNYHIHVVHLGCLSMLIRRERTFCVKKLTSFILEKKYQNNLLKTKDKVKYIFNNCRSSRRSQKSWSRSLKQLGMRRIGSNSFSKSLITKTLFTISVSSRKKKIIREKMSRSNLITYKIIL